MGYIINIWLLGGCCNHRKGNEGYKVYRQAIVFKKSVIVIKFEVY